ncbi:Protein of unknown function [Streptomyces sp. DI166]|nr:Protein of unknown function [Streptomyces sp. DI166]
MDHSAEVEESHGRSWRGVLRPRWIVSFVAVAAVISSGLLFVDSLRVESGPKAGDPKCSDVVDRSPDKVGSEDRDWVIGKGVASWGDRSTVLRCGVEELQPTVNLCVSADGVDWVLDEKRLKETGVSVLTTYGRSPAVEVTYSGSREEVGGVLVELNESVAGIPQKRKCLGYDDAL